MADIIKVSPDKLKKTASSLENTGKAIKNTTAEMLSEIIGISKNVWSGDAAVSFVNKFKGMQGDIKKMCQRVGDQAVHLRTIATEYENTERANQASAASLHNSVY